MVGRRDLDDDEPPAIIAPRPTRLPLIAVVLAVAAALLLVVAVLRRHATIETTAETEAGSGSAGEVPPPPPPPVVNPLADQAVAAMFGAVCRHEVACGIGDLGRCDYIETTMKQMPKTFAIQPCLDFDEAAAKQCLDELAARSCEDFAKSLDVLDLKQALDRITSCRRTCR